MSPGAVGDVVETQVEGTREEELGFPPAMRLAILPRIDDLPGGLPVDGHRRNDLEYCGQNVLEQLQPRLVFQRAGHQVGDEHGRRTLRDGRPGLREIPRLLERRAQ